MAVSPGLQLRRLLKKDTIVIPGFYECLSGLLIQKAGFKAAYLTGAGLSVSALGQPDIGLLTMDEVAHVLRRAARVMSIPILVDGDTGYGGERNVARTVREFEAAGAAGIQIEDQEFPKRCGHLSGKSVVPAEQMVAKIKAAKAARRDKNFMIVARTDARGVTGLKDALRRAALYKKAGADMIFPEALRTKQEFQSFGRIKALGLLMANMTEFGLSPEFTVAELAHLGYRVALYPMTAFRVAALSMERALDELKKSGHSHRLLDQMQTRRELYDLIRYPMFEKLEKQLLRMK